MTHTAPHASTAPTAPGRGAAQRQALLADAGGVLAATALDYEATLRAVGRLLVPAVADLCVVDVTLPDGGLRRAEVAAADPALAAAAAELRAMPLAPAGAADPLRRAVDAGRAVLVRHAADGAPAPAGGAAPRSLVAAPLVARGRTLGVLALISTGPAGDYDQEDVELAVTLGERVGAALDGATLYREAQEARAAAEAASRWSAYLGRMSELLAESIDYRATLARVGELIVPTLADFSQIYLVEEGANELRRVASTCVDPEKAELLREIDRRPPFTLDGEQPQVQVVRTGESLLVPAIDEALLARTSQDDEHLALLLRFNPQSLIAVPLAAHGRVLGVLLCGQFGTDRPYGEDDLHFALELARRAALAVDNARLYEAARHARDEAEQARGRADLARRAAEDANLAKANFLATMSHELRTPLSAIIGYSELLTDGISGPVSEGQQAQLQRITASARHLLALIEDILAFARVDPGRDDVVAQEPVDVGTLARETAALVEPIATTQGLALDVHAADGGPWARTDARKLRQILLNLLGNAVRYSERGTIRLAVATGEGDVTITVADQGIGISPAHLERIFDAFWQVDQNHTRRVGGTGLGLSISRRLAELLGGELRVQSAVGVGSTFTLRIPLVRPDDGAAAPA